MEIKLEIQYLPFVYAGAGVLPTRIRDRFSCRGLTSDSTAYFIHEFVTDHGEFKCRRCGVSLKQYNWFWPQRLGCMAGRGVAGSDKGVGV